MNGWLDPTVVGNFRDTSSLEIRTSLTLEDTPMGLPGASDPLPEDTLADPVEYPISAGDTLAIEVFELRQRQVPFQTQVAVASAGYVNLPAVGRVQAAGLTVPEFEVALADSVRNAGILVNPDVTVNPLFQQKATYSIFGIGVSASNNAPLRAGTFPIRRPDLRLLEAINQVGGLNEFVTEIYVFRYTETASDTESAAPAPPPQNTPDSPESTPPEESEPTKGGRDPQPTVPSGNASPEPDPETAEPPGDRAAAIIDAVLAGEEGSAPPTPPAGNDAVRGAAAAPPQSQPEPQRTQPPPDAVRALEPEPSQPYIYVHGEFVPNPAFKAPAGEGGPPALASPLDTTAPAVNWSRIAGDTSYRIIRVPAEPLRSGDPQVNITVRGGDVIRIASGEIGVYYMMGQVNRVGPFAFNAEPITLKAAIAAAGGLSGLAWPDRCTVYRRLGQREQMIQVNLDRIFAGKDPDFFIKRGDIVNVGTHPFAPFLQVARGLSIPNPVSNLGYSFTYARNFADIDSFAVQQNPANQPSTLERLLP